MNKVEQVHIDAANKWLNSGMIAERDATRTMKLAQHLADAFPADRWMPIESAPKDGRMPILLGHPRYDPVVGWWLASENRWALASYTNGQYMGHFAGMRSEIFRPTHWMPLPPPSSEEARA